MPTEFSIGGAINGLGRRVGRSPLLRGTVGRPLVALAIVVIIVAVAMHYAPRDPRDRLLVVAAVVAVAWLHYHVRSSELLEGTNTGRSRDMFAELRAMPAQGGLASDDSDGDGDSDGDDAGSDSQSQNADDGVMTYPSVVLPGDVGDEDE